MFDNFYGFTGKPFQLTPDPDFYFRSATHKKALSYLGYGLAQSEGFIVITGEIGAGKSTLVAHMVENIDPAQLTVAQVVTSKLDEDELIHVVARSFGIAIDGHDKASALSEIEAFLHEEAREGRRCLLVVDEAQNLSIGGLEELRMLTNFQLGNHPLLQILLLGQPEFRDLVKGDPALEQLRQRIIASHHLGPMEKGEIEPYLIHRLEHVGWAGNPAFDQRVFHELHEASGGIPRRVNQIVNRVLLLGAVEERQKIDAAMLQQVLAEMAGDNDAGATGKPIAAAPAAMPLSGAMVDASPLDLSQFEAMLGERDAQIAELQQAVVELANVQEASSVDGGGGQIAALNEQIAKLEARMFEQERTIRQTLSMLIEWIESEMEATKAA